MAVGQSSILLKTVTSGVSSVFPAWLGSVFFGAPTAKPLIFAADISEVKSEQGGFTAPIALLQDATPFEKTHAKAQNVDVYLPQSAALERRIDVPKKSLSQLNKLANLDLVQKTPFKPAQIYSVATVVEKDATRASVAQWIVKRDQIEHLRARLTKLGFQTRQVFIAGTSTAALADFSDEIAPHRKTWRRINAVLFAAIALGAISLWARPALETHQARLDQEQALGGLRATAVSLRQDVEAIRGSADLRAAFLDRVTKRPLLSTTLRDTTIALPDVAWISDLEFNRNILQLRGLIDGSAAQLVLDLTETKKFRNPRLTGPISQTIDGEERFDLALDLRRGAN